MLVGVLAVVGGVFWIGDRRQAQEGRERHALQMAAMDLVAGSDPWPMALRNATERMKTSLRMHGKLAPFIVVGNIADAFDPPGNELRKISERFWEIKSRTTEAAKDEIVQEILVDAEPWIKELRGAALELQGRVLIGQSCEIEDVDSEGCWRILCENKTPRSMFRLIGKSADKRLDIGSTSKKDRVDVCLLIAVARPSIQLGPGATKKGSDRAASLPDVSGFYVDRNAPHELFGLFVVFNEDNLASSLEGLEAPCGRFED